MIDVPANVANKSTLRKAWKEKSYGIYQSVSTHFTTKTIVKVDNNVIPPVERNINDSIVTKIISPEDDKSTGESDFVPPQDGNSTRDLSVSNSIVKSIKLKIFENDLDSEDIEKNNEPPPSSDDDENSKSYYIPAISLL